MCHCRSDVTHEGQVATSSGCLTDHHGTSSQLYAIKTTFKLIQISIFSENSGCQQWWSMAVVMRPDKMWNKVPYCPLRLRSHWAYMVSACFQCCHIGTSNRLTSVKVTGAGPNGPMTPIAWQMDMLDHRVNVGVLLWVDQLANSIY